MADLNAIVAGTVDDADLSGLSLDELKELHTLEENREKPRSSMLSKIQAEIALSEEQDEDDNDSSDEIADRQDASAQDEEDDDGGIAARNKTMEVDGLDD